jgi:hypothetical protein
MFQRKLIAVLSVAALLAVTAGVGHASLSRVEGMGLSSPALSQFTDDYANIYLYPASVVRQNNLVLAEVGNNPSGDVNSVAFDDQSFTLIRNFPSFGVVSVQMKQSATNLYTGSSNVNNEWFDLIWGRAFTKMDFAVRFDMANSYYEDTFGPPSSTYKARGIDGSFDPYPFGAGFFDDAIVGTGVELNTWGITPSIALHMSNDNRLDLSATYRNYTLDRSSTGPAFAPETWKDGGNASYALAARYFANKSAASQWYFSGWYVNDDLSWDVTGVTATPRSADETYRNYGVGFSNNMRVNDNNLLLWGITVSQAKHKYERTDNNDAVASGATKTFEDKDTSAPTLFAAIETNATNWLKLRIGATNAIHHTNSKFTDFITPPDTDNNKQAFTDFNLALGAGLRWNNLDVDMTMNEAFPLSGGYILSGDQATPFTRVSGTYHF